MYIQTLKQIMAVRGLNQADIARLAGVSRAAVTKWFHAKDGRANVETQTLFHLAAGLQLEPTAMLQPMEDLTPLQPRFLWDGLYPNMELFTTALARFQLPATARLIQILGFHQGTAVIGKKAVTLFPRYKKYLKPVRRKELEVLWPLYISHP